MAKGKRFYRNRSQPPRIQQGSLKRSGVDEVKVQTAKEIYRLREWAAQISAQQQSGLDVKQWCETQGICTKTFYGRRKRVQEEMLDAIETGDTAFMGGPAGQAGVIPGPATQAGPLAVAAQMRHAKPVFAALPMPQAKGPAVTVRMGGIAVNIGNDADHAIVKQVLKVVSQL